MESITSNFDSLTQEDMRRYSGKWVAIIEGKVVIEGVTFKEVYLYVKEKYPHKKPLIGKIPEATPMVLHSIK